MYFALSLRKDLLLRLLIAGLLWWGLTIATIDEVWAAGGISLLPASGTGSQFSVQVLIDTGGEPTVETDLILRYDPAILQVGEIVFGQLYPENVSTIDSVSGRMSSFSYFSTANPGDAFTGEGVLATVKFIGLKPGIASVTVNCTTGATNDSNIIRQGSTADLLDCQQIVNGSYTVTASGATVTPGGELPTVFTPTPTVVRATATPVAVRTPTPTLISETGTGSLSPTPIPDELMASGSVTPTLTLSLVGVMLLMSSLVLFIW